MPCIKERCFWETRAPPPQAAYDLQEKKNMVKSMSISSFDYALYLHRREARDRIFYI